MTKEFVPYNEALELKELGFDETCLGYYNDDKHLIIASEPNFKASFVFDNNNPILAPTFSQAINFLYICSNKQIDIELKASDSYEERVRKINQGCKDLRNLQNNKSNR